MLLPTAIDGGTQLLGLRESTNPLRLISGILFGLAVVWFTYPQIANLDKEFQKVSTSEEKTSLPETSGKRT